MPRLKRSGRTVTFSVSVSPETKAQLRQAADRSFGGNVSAVIEAIAREAGRREALDWLLASAPPVDDGRFAAFMNELNARPKRRRRKAA